MNKDDTQIRIAYTGSAVTGGVMDAREFTQALTGLYHLFEHADKLVNGGKRDVSVQVHSTFKDGSFDFLLLLAEHVPHIVNNLGMAVDVEDLPNWQRVLKYLGMFRRHGGLLYLYHWLRGQKPADATPTNGGKISLVREDGETMDVSKEEYSLYIDPGIRKSVRKLVSPVYKNDGIDGIEVRPPEGGEFVARVDWQVVRYYHDFENIDMSKPQESEVRLYLVTVQLEGDGKWAFRHGGKGIIKAKMLDKKFSQKMDKNERFARGDMIRANIREWKWLAGARQSEYEIVEVLEHVEASSFEQGSLPGMGEKGEVKE